VSYIKSNKVAYQCGKNCLNTEKDELSSVQFIHKISIHSQFLISSKAS